MFTPRRTLMLLAGFVLFGAAYGVYARFLGWLDGLPQLPEKMLRAGENDFLPPDRPILPTQQKLALAFGPNCLETDYSIYATQLEFRRGETSIVLAAGPAPANPESNRVALAPFSLAFFGKAKPPHLRQPGEEIEISTIHSDKAILEFDRVIRNPNDMRDAKLVRLELVSDFEQALKKDKRRGMVYITNNQRTADPNRYLVIRTPGPVFYRDAKIVAGTPAAQGPDMWTDAPIEIVDRQNLPLQIGSGEPTTSVSRSDELRNSAAIREITGGRRAPPPTVTAIGMRIYLDPPTSSSEPKPVKSGGGISGVRRLELLEAVLVNLWVDDGVSLGTNAGTLGNSEETRAANPLAYTPPPPAIAAVAGNLATAAHSVGLHNRALLQIETLGPFAYDSEKALARFDVVPQSNPNLPNDVQVTKVSPREGNSTLFSQVLELELNGGATTAARPGNSSAIKRLHAWTHTPGRLLTVASESQAMQAYGSDLVHEQAEKRTILTGSPLYVVRDKNVLLAGSPQQAATLITEPGPLPPHKAQLTVRGPGEVKLIDAATNSTSVKATWKTSLVQSREIVDEMEQELFVFTGGARFDDVNADFWLQGDVLKLWLEPKQPTDLAEEIPRNGPQQPSRVLALGSVVSHSADFDIEHTDQLNVFFADSAVVADKKQSIPPRAPLDQQPGDKPQPAPNAKEPRSQKPPMKIRAKDIKTWITREQREGSPTAVDNKEPVNRSMKYQLERAVCEDDVVIHQDPVDPSKPRGIDIHGRLLEIQGSPDGRIMTVFGWPNRPGEVHQEDISLIGPEIILDQVHNLASVKGRGALTMPTKSDLAGSELKKSEVIVIHWREKMTFNGAKRFAEFEGKVQAKQGGSWVLCHTMNVTFDRPIFFNQLQKKAAEASDGEKAKVHSVFCYPAAADSADDKSELHVVYHQVETDGSGKPIKTQQLTAVELRMFAQAKKPEGGEKYQLAVADGPGVLRIWQAGEKELAGRPAGGENNPRPDQPAPPRDSEQEMKLTVVEFTSRMTAIDKQKLYQEATFTDQVRVIHAPSDSPNMEIVRHRLPPRAILLQCNKELVVWSHKKGDAPPLQRMDATGNARILSEEYDGWGESISTEGKMVTLSGSQTTPARIMNRFNKGTDQIAEKIIYNRGTGGFKFINGSGGTIGPPSGK